MQKDLTEKIENLIKERFGKLEKVRPFISLKMYDATKEKLEREALIAHGSMETRAKENEKREKPQILPKPFFEQRTLSKKPIRID